MSKKHPLYSAWNNMRSRCNTPTCPIYKYYGGRGIKVCERWDSFASFAADMGMKPTPDHTLDRIDNNGDYEPTNCRWATRQEQVINRGRQCNNTSGHVGVSWDKSRNKWLAHVKRNRKFINIGRFITIEEAIAARNQWIKGFTNV